MMLVLQLEHSDIQTICVSGMHHFYLLWNDRQHYTLFNSVPDLVRNVNLPPDTNPSRVQNFRFTDQNEWIEEKNMIQDRVQGTLYTFKIKSITLFSGQIV